MWTDYKKTFPVQYINLGYFDEYVRQVVLEKKPKLILDVGGGIDGSVVLKGTDSAIYLLDPFISVNPEWMDDKVDWDTTKQFDLIVARGSINYLTKDELDRVKSLLNPFGTFIANTFLVSPPEQWTKRPYETVAGEKGVERFRYNQEKGVVEHELLPEHGVKIAHTFFYYSPEEYKTMFPGLKIINHKKNSAILYFEK